MNVNGEDVVYTEINNREVTEREKILNEAKRVICQDRQDQYGNAENSFETIARYWSVYLGIGIELEDVAHMMALLKIARCSNQKYHEDNYIDACGYEALAGEIASKGRKIWGK